MIQHPDIRRGAKFVKTITSQPPAIRPASPPPAPARAPEPSGVAADRGLVDELSTHLAPELAAVDAHIGSILESDTDLVREVGAYVRGTSGKRLRPIITLLSARACGHPAGHPDAPKVAAALELVHTATLLHDDVIDKAPLRRGRPTVNAKWGDDVAILIADYLYSNAFGLAMQSLPPQVLSLVCQVTARMCEGELFQIEKRDTRLTREDYLRIVRGKTAFLFSACAGLGAVLAGAGDDRTEAMTRFGLGFGVAFQISDDSLDMVAPDEDLGKLHGTDIRNGKQTLPLILAYGAAPPADRAALWSAWEAADADRVFALVATHRGVDRALGEARDIVAEAKAKLAGLPEGPDARYLARLADYVVNRNY